MNVAGAVGHIDDVVVLKGVCRVGKVQHAGVVGGVAELSDAIGEVIAARLASVIVPAASSALEVDEELVHTSLARPESVRRAAGADCVAARIDPIPPGSELNLWH